MNKPAYFLKTILTFSVLFFCVVLNAQNKPPINKRPTSTLSIQSQGAWFSRGPASINHSHGGTQGIGRAIAMAIDPSDSNTIYLSASGLWKSIDDGNHWTLLRDSIAGSLLISYLTVDPSNSNVLYAVVSGKLYKSTDAALTWSLINGGSGITTVLINPLNTQILLLPNSAGISRSTDGGITWNVINSSGYTNLTMKPGNPNVLYGLRGGNQFFVSHDGGVTFTSTATLVSNWGFMQMAVTPADSNYVYLFGSNNNGSGGQVAISTDGGNTFTVQAVSNNIFSGSNMSNFVVSETNKLLLIQGSIDCSRSTDGGLTWSYAASWNNPSSTNPEYEHPDNRFSLFRGSSYWACTDGGIYKSVDGGVHWIDKTAGMALTSFYTLACSESDTSVFLGGCLDNAHFIHTSSGWVNIFDGDGYNSAINPSNPLILFGKYQYGYYRSYDGGVTKTITPFTGLTESVSGYSPSNPLVFNHQNTRSLYFLATNVWKSTDNGGHAVKLSNFSSGSGGTFLYVCKTDSNIIFTNSYRTSNSGISWVPISKNVLAVDPDEPNKIWAVSGYGQPFSIFFSSDTGNTWSAIQSYGLSGISTVKLCCANNSHNGVFLYGGTNVYYFDDRLSNWQLFNTGLPYVPISDMTVLDTYNKVRVVTEGRGMYESSLFDSTQAPMAHFISDKRIICEGDTVHFFDNSLNNGPGYNAVYHWYFSGGTPSVSNAVNPTVVYRAYGTYSVSLYILNNNGSDSVATTSWISVTPPPTGTVPLVEGFEESYFPPTGWNANHYNQLPSWAASFAYQNDYGGYLLSTKSLLYYQWTGNQVKSDYFTTPNLNIASIYNPILVFDYCYPFDYQFAQTDTFKIFYTTDCGFTPNYIFTKGGMMLKTDSTYGNYVFQPKVSSWRTDTIYLTALANLNPVQLGFQVNSIGRCEVYIDNINIKQGPSFTTGLKDNAKSADELLLYPNPTNDQLNVNYTLPLGSQNAELTIYNLNGDICARQQLSSVKKSTQIDVSALPAGMYICKIQANNILFKRGRFSIIR